MLGRQGRDAAAARIEERRACDGERPDALGRDGLKRRVDLVLAVGAQDMNTDADGPRGVLDVTDLTRRRRKGRVQ